MRPLLSKRRLFLLHVIFLPCFSLLMSTQARVFADSAASGSEWENAPVEKLTKKLFEDEAWIWQAANLYIEYDLTLTRSEESIRSFIHKSKTRRPNIDWDDPEVLKQYKHAQPKIDGIEILAWNDTELYHKLSLPLIDEVEYLWDGDFATTYVIQGGEPSHCFYKKNLSAVSFTCKARFWWQRIRSYAHWWASDTDRSKQYSDAGIQSREGSTYRVLKQKNTELWINMDTGFLAHIRSLRDNKLFSEFTLEDWTKIATGQFFPYQQIYRIYHQEGPYVGKAASASIWEVKSIIYNQANMPDVFHVSMPEGLEVIDDRYETTLNYPYSKNRSDREQQEIIDTELAKNQFHVKAQNKRKSLISKSAPEIHASQWLNSPPLLLKALKGKFVVLDFFADWCVPCRPYYPLLQHWSHKQEYKDDLVIIGIHTDGSELSNIHKLVEQYQLEQVPITIDIGDSNSRYWGVTYGTYAVDAIPTSVLIDRDGKVVMFGKLDKTLNEVKSRIEE